MNKLVEAHSKSLMSVAVAACIAGIGILAPGALDTIANLANGVLQLHLDLDVPKWVGWVLLIAGVIGGGTLFWLARNASPAARKIRKFLAVTHTSFPTPCPPLNRELAQGEDDVVATRVCDLAPFFSEHLDVVAALRQQMVLVSDIRGVQRANDTEIGYAGIVHIPLQFHLGSSLATGAHMRLFEKDRVSSQWIELAATGPELDVQTVWTDVAEPLCAAVRVNVSYLIEEPSVRAVVPNGCIDVSISIGAPRIDAVRAYSQVAELANEFRQVMDSLKVRLPSTAEVHVFYAGPVSAGISLGRQLSQTIHNPTYVHNYQRQSNPAYAWSLLVNGGAHDVRRAGGEHV